MKIYYLNSIGRMIRLSLTGLPIVLFMLIYGCKKDDPAKENVPELITRATLTFTPTGGGSAITATATDPDGEGVQDIETDGPINLTANTEYTLSLNLINGLAEPASPEYNITGEVENESDEHMFFFAWTNDLFSDPAGNGNVDNRGDDVNYNDQDVNGQPLGLSTAWTTAATSSSGTFRILLKHQPGLKSATSGSETGETDLDITFDANIN